MVCPLPELWADRLKSVQLLVDQSCEDAERNARNGRNRKNPLPFFFPFVSLFSAVSSSLFFALVFLSATSSFFFTLAFSLAASSFFFALVFPSATTSFFFIDLTLLDAE